MQSLISVPVDAVHPDPENPRHDMGDIDGLAQSIAETGLIQPLVVRPNGQEGHYFVVAGHRRLAALSQLGVATVDVIVNDSFVPDGDGNVTAAQLVENLQRHDLRPCEEAANYERLVKQGFRQAEIAAKVGVNQSYISKRLSLLKLPADVQLLVDSDLLDVRLAERLVKIRDEEQVRELAGSSRLNEQLIDNVIEREKAVAQAEKLYATVVDKLKGVKDLVVFFGREEFEEERVTLHNRWSLGDDTEWPEIVKELKADHDAEIDYVVVEVPFNRVMLTWLRKAMPVAEGKDPVKAEEARQVKEHNANRWEMLKALVAKPRKAETHEQAAHVFLVGSMGRAKEICSLLELAPVKVKAPTEGHPDRVQTDWQATLRSYLASATVLEETRAIKAAYLLHDWQPRVRAELDAAGIPEVKVVPYSG